MTNATVCMPWRPQPDRLAAHQRVRDFWDHHGFPVVEADATSVDWNLSQARNRAVTAAAAPICIVADADTIPDIAAVHRAVKRIKHGERGVIWPFTMYRHIPGEWAQRADLLAAPIDQLYRRSVGGLFVVSAHTYWELGGMDERFVGWGYEDNAFHIAALTLSKVRREEGVVFSFNHSVECNRNLRGNPNVVLYDKYRAAQFNSARMRVLINR